MPQTLLKWSFDNSKLVRTKTVSFGLPAFRSANHFAVCPGADVCPAYCYARQARYTLPESQAVRELNLSLARFDLVSFERFAIADLTRIAERTIRVHDSGDYFSQEYLDCWFRIAAQFPRKLFYSYTKSLHLEFSRRPANFRIIQSFGGKWDALIDVTKSHTRVFATHEECIAAGYVNGTKTDRPAMQGVIKIGLVYHGTRNLTEAQAKTLRRKVESNDEAV